MGNYKLYHSKTFDKKLEDFDPAFHEWLDNIENQLIENPYVGKPLGVTWFREKKYGKFRVYYLIYDNVKSVYMVAISEKKDQQRVINSIRMLLDFYKKEIENFVKPT